MLKGRDIVCIANVPWDYLKIAAQQTMKYLSIDNRVLFIEKPISMAAYIYDKDVLKKARQLQKRGVYKEINNLYAWMPPLYWPFGAKSLLANKLTAGRMLPHIKKAVSELEFKSPILWIFNAFLGPFFTGKFNESLVVYDCTDEFSADPKVNSAMYKKLEHRLLASSDIVLAISRNLVADKKKYNDNVHYLPIGGEPEHFLTCHDEKLKLPDDIAALKKPVIGYYGRLDERFDSAWTLAIAKKYPDASIALIGPSRGGQVEAALKKVPNIHFLGSKDYTLLPAYLKAFDVCIMPYVMSDFVLNIFPNKIFEYLASGRPVITSRIPSLQDLSDDGVVDIAGSEDEFVQLVGKGLVEKDEELRNRRIESAKNNSWLARADKASDIIEDFEKKQS